MRLSACCIIIIINNILSLLSAVKIWWRYAAKANTRVVVSISERASRIGTLGDKTHLSTVCVYRDGERFASDRKIVIIPFDSCETFDMRLPTYLYTCVLIAAVCLVCRGRRGDGGDDDDDDECQRLTQCGGIKKTTMAFFIIIIIIIVIVIILYNI